MGTVDEVTQVAKAFRVYYRRSSTLTPSGDNAEEKKKKTDYLVDHSIFTYLMDREGEYVTVFGKDARPVDMADAIRKELARAK